jgi:ribokinase
MVAKIVVIGSFNTDLTAYMERTPAAGETVMGYRFVTGPGGKGSNQAVAAARLGADVTFVGRVGNDAFGEIGIKMWEAEGINTQFVGRDPANSTGVAPIWVDDTGENRIVVVSGANMAVGHADVDAASSAITQADVLLVQLEIPLETSQYALQIARQHGVRTILNPAPAAKLPADMLILADYVTPNETELAILTGRAFDAENGASFLAHAEQTLVITMGAQGAQWIRKDGGKLIPTFPVDVVDTTGAGDAFNGGLAVALAEGKAIEEAITFANATAALSVTRLGTAPSMPTRTEVEALLKTTRG